MISNKDYRFKKRETTLISPGNAKLIWSDTNNKFLPWINCNSFCMFRKKFRIDFVPVNAKFKVMVDSKMCLYINGKFVKRTLYSGLISARIYDEIDITSYIVPGENTIAILALHYGYDTVYSQNDRPGLLYECRISSEKGEFLDIVSDNTTKAKICDAYDRFAPKISNNGGCIEIFDNRRYDDSWIYGDFDDSDWHSAAEDTYEFPSSSHTKRMTDAIVEKVHNAKAIISGSTFFESGKEGIFERITEEVETCRFNDMYVVGSSCEIPPCDIGKISYVVVKFGKVRRGRIVIDCDGFSGDILDVIYGDSFENGIFKISGIASFTLKNGKNMLETRFDDCIFQYVMIIARNHVKTVKLNDVSMIADRYNFEYFMDFSSDNESLNNIFETVKSSIKNLYMAETVNYKGCEPYWNLSENRWGNLAYSIISGDDVHLKRNIIKYAELIDERGYRKSVFSQNKAGKMVLDSLVWISSFGDLVDLTDETYLFERYLNRIVSTLRWITNFEDSDGLITGIDTPKFSSTVINGIYLQTIENVIKITKRIDAITEYNYYKAKHKNLLKLLKEKLWNEEKGLYCDGLYENQPVDSFTQDANGIAILAFHEKNERRINSIIKNAFENKNICVTNMECFVKAMLKADRPDIVNEQLKTRMSANAMGIFLIEGLIGLDMYNVKDGTVKPFVRDGVDFKAKIKTRFRTIEIEVKNSKYKIR